MSDEGKESDPAAASVTLPAPPRLAKWAAASGFTAEIVLTRKGETSPDAKDPDADPGPIDDPIEGDELELLRGLLAAYDVAGKRNDEDEGKGEPPAHEGAAPTSEPPPAE